MAGPVRAWRHIPRRGQKLTREDVEEIHKRIWYTTTPMKDIAKEFGVSAMTITHIARGTTWRDVAEKHIPDEFAHFLKKEPKYESEQ